MNRETMSKHSRMHNLRKAKLRRIDRKYAQMERAIERQYNRYKNVAIDDDSYSIPELIDLASAYKLPSKEELDHQEKEWQPDHYAVMRHLIPKRTFPIFKSMFPMTEGETEEANSNEPSS